MNTLDLQPIDAPATNVAARVAAMQWPQIEADLEAHGAACVPFLLDADECRALKALYEFIGERPFAHDFDNVEFDATEFDARLGTPGLHRVGKRVRFEPRETVLPPEIFRRYENDNFWENPALNPRKVLIV